MVKKNVKASPSKTNEDAAIIKDPNEESPSWYHYVVVLGGIFLFFWAASLLVNLFNASQDVEIVDVVDSKETYNYVHTVGNVTYNIELIQPIEELRKLNYRIEPNLIDILNTLTFTFSFGGYNGSDNGQVTLASTKLRRYLSLVHFVNFKPENFVSGQSPSCEGSSSTNRVVTFELNMSSNSSYVSKEDNGCVRFIVNSAKEFPYLMDYFIVSILQEK